MNPSEPTRPQADPAGEATLVGDQTLAGDTTLPLDSYCARPRAKVPAALLELPWGERLEIAGRLVFGREGDIPEAMKQRLAQEFDNVSRRHAELACADGRIWVVDLGSANGTFVNDERLPPNIRRTLAAGDVLRFAARLSATVRLA